MTADALAQLMEWYASQCDGDWEHEYGISIQTLDNPGWRLKINLAGTEHQDRILEHTVRDIVSDTSWSDCWVEGTQFHAACGPRDLPEVINFFMKWIARR